MPVTVSQEHLDALCPELSAVVTDACRAGNEVSETWRGFGDVVALRRARPVLVALAPAVLDLLRHRRTDDPHHWLAELHCAAHPGWMVVLPFTPDARDAGLGSLPVGVLQR